MTDQRELDRLMAAFFTEGSEELADRVIDAALDQIDHTEQRRRTSAPRRINTMTMPFRLAAAAVIGVLAIGGLWFFMHDPKTNVGVPTTTFDPNASPSATGGFSPTGAMEIDRYAPATTLLSDGRILVTGGYVGGVDAQVSQAAAEVYDPATGNWTRTADMAYARRYHTATLLPDGKVLVAGGGGAEQTAELWDPRTGTWTTTLAMVTERAQQAAALLADGRVLVAGGDQDGGRTSEIYDPATEQWTPAGSMTTWRASAAATLLADGRVLVDGGFANDEIGAAHTSAEIYDPTTDTWTATGDMHAERKDEQAATRLPDGRVLVVGGPVGQMSGDVFDPTTGAWERTGPLVRQYREQVATALLPDGSVLLVGGDPTRSSTALAERYDPATNTWTDAGALTAADYVRSATALLDGRVVIVGSSTTTGGGGAPVDLYLPNP